jgi:DNA-binding response OmpR family regulator
VLVVDDNRDIVLTMMALLRSDGHDSKACYDGSEVLDCVKDYDPDVVLLDIGLPGENGWEVARRIRGIMPGTRPMLIAITGQYTKGADRILAQMNGIDYYLVKPADPKVLLSLLQQAKPSR